MELEKAWGLYYLVTGQPQRAVEHLRRAADVEPALWLQIAAVEGQSGEATAEQLRATLVTARERLEQQFAAEPANVRYRILYATSLYHLDELERAEEVLREGMAAGDHPAFRQLLAAVCVRRYDRRVARAGDGETGAAAAGAGATTGAEATAGAEADAGGLRDASGLREGLGELQRALELDPRCGPALERLLALSRTSPEVLEESRRTLRGLIAAGEASAMAHFTLGTLDWLAGDGEQAGLHLRQALALDAALPVVANNLAHVIGEDPEGDLEAALALVCEAVEAEPENPAFLDTRGRIYEKQGQWAAAAADYQRALAASPEPRRVQQKLAEIYEKLGEPALAAQFREAARSPQPVELE
ncbi:tetratricopeptide repeat protein [Candidatus Laterigemmans baculatus]|uniref:tetratricopeptide repeat protein n=1 Tax=Candidatus Laterigemmans baculatus TaxID=2770505 RepID=UPI0013DB41FA|nr:tetratricopeptide repeat protein [Candidatus Laterigemmans baculatus]